MKQLKALSLVMIIWCLPLTACQQSQTTGSAGEPHMIVDEPRVEITAFTNWQEIQVTYPVRWLDGYKPLLDKAKPEAMSFSAIQETKEGKKELERFEFDPIKGQELIQVNQRKYKKENYVDLVYYLRYIGETKGDLMIPEQSFYYISEEPGKPEEGQEAHEVKAPALKLRYDSVLTKDANDIMDTIDFGSFMAQAKLFRNLAWAIPFLGVLFLVLLFWRPVVVSAKQTTELQAVTDVPSQSWLARLPPKEALAHFDRRLDELKAKLSADPSAETVVRGELCNELRGFLLSYVPGLLESETLSLVETQNKISRLNNAKKQDILRYFSNSLKYHEEALYGAISGRLVVNDFDILKKYTKQLRSWRLR